MTFEEWWEIHGYSGSVGSTDAACSAKATARAAWDAGRAELEANWALVAPPARYDTDDDPLTMPVERLRERVAIEVMGWQKDVDMGAMMWRTADRWIMVCHHFCPDINPAHTQMVKDKMLSHGAGASQLSLVLTITRDLVGAIFCGVGVERHLADYANDKIEGAAVCRAALVAMRARR